MTKGVRFDLSISKANIDSHEHATRRTFHACFDVSARNIIEMVTSGDKLPQFIDGQRTPTRRQKCSDIDSKIRLKEGLNILCVNLPLSNRGSSKRSN